jgi:hypothetical protein
MEIPKKLIDFLNENKVTYEILHHPEAFTAQTIAAAEHIKGRHHAKVVMAKSGSQHLMMVLAANQRIDLEKLEKISAEPASLESEKERRRRSGRPPGDRPAMAIGSSQRCAVEDWRAAVPRSRCRP